MSRSSLQFDSAFQALTDHAPLGWQRRLFDRLRSGQDVPRVCDLPTGLGKTSVIPIWLIALAHQVEDGSVTLPRRLVYVVNRRTVVDQATSVVEQIRERLLVPDDSRWSKHEAFLRSLAGALQALASTEQSLLAVSTLRGELADNEEWKADPARPAIIVGTIDMIGSKLLFSGYGDGRYWRAQHAGLIAQDSLIVHDEAHLTPSFSEVLRQVAEAQRQACEPRPMRVMELSATSRGGDDDVLTLEPEDEEDERTGAIVKARLDATKLLKLHPLEEAEVVGKLLELSRAHDDKQAKVLIYVRLPEHAKDAANQLGAQLGAAAETRIGVLTGTIRGHERDELVTSPVYRAMMDPNSKVDQTVYLVSTSAGEVGIDLDADHMVCDLTTLDSMIQRLGRVNRRGGEGRAAQVDVLVQGEANGSDKPPEFERAIEATRVILNRWITESNGLDVSPRGLRALVDALDEEEKRSAFAPSPTVPPLTDILLDAWSLTSVTKQMPGRPEVAPYLHGLTNDPPETYVVWRKEVQLLYEAQVDADTLSDWFQACRIEACERLRDRMDRVKKTLEALLKAHRRKDESRDFPVVLLDERGEAAWSRLSKIIEKEFKLAYRTVVLPLAAGGLSKRGILDADALEEARDVAEPTTVGIKGTRRERWLLVKGADGKRCERLDTGEAADFLPRDLSEHEQLVLQQPAEGSEEEGVWRYLLLMVEPKQSALENPERAKTTQTLALHSQLIVEHMNRIADALQLSKLVPSLRNALSLAAERHDWGKDRAVWQRFACNPDAHTPVAKSTKYLHGRALGGYRHEFGSLLQAGAEDKVHRHDEADLIMHLIAAHHGWARPHFESSAWDHSRTTAENEQQAVEIMRRFGRLQQRFGRWGLAWLEALLRCADIAASNPSAKSTDSSQRREADA